MPFPAAKGPKKGTLTQRQRGSRLDAKTAPQGVTIAREFTLEMLIQRAGRPVAKAALADSVFGFGDEANINAIDSYVHRVREKLEGSDVGIATLRGLGYVLRRQNGG